MLFYTLARNKQLADLGFDVGSTVSTVSDPEGVMEEADEFDDSLENLLALDKPAENKKGTVTEFSLKGSAT